MSVASPLTQSLDPSTQTLLTYLPMFDGNGNVMGMIKASSGSIDAAYEYDAFGNTLRATGSYAGSNLFRFSTKFTDTETCLVYYGLRYYSPTLGRFINKDPIEEQGGLNLYGFCGNNGVNRWDMLGMTGTSWLLDGNGSEFDPLDGEKAVQQWLDDQQRNSRFNTFVGRSMDRLMYGHDQAYQIGEMQDRLSAMPESTREFAEQFWTVSDAIAGAQRAVANSPVIAPGGLQAAAEGFASGTNAAVHQPSGVPFPAVNGEQEAALIAKFRDMALETNNGKIGIGYVENKGYKFVWTDAVLGGVDPYALTINLPRSSWQDTPWTMIHESAHIMDAANGWYSADKGWRMWRHGEERAYSAENTAYRQYQRLHPGYSSPGGEAINDLIWKDPKAFQKFIDDNYKPTWEKIRNQKPRKQ